MSCRIFTKEAWRNIHIPIFFYQQYICTFNSLLLNAAVMVIRPPRYGTAAKTSADKAPEFCFPQSKEELMLQYNREWIKGNIIKMKQYHKTHTHARTHNWKGNNKEPRQKKTLIITFQRHTHHVQNSIYIWHPNSGELDAKTAKQMLKRGAV